MRGDLNINEYQIVIVGSVFQNKRDPLPGLPGQLKTGCPPPTSDFHWAGT